MRRRRLHEGLFKIDDQEWDTIIEKVLSAFHKDFDDASARVESAGKEALTAAATPAIRKLGDGLASQYGIPKQEAIDRLVRAVVKAGPGRTPVNVYIGNVTRTALVGPVSGSWDEKLWQSPHP